MLISLGFAANPYDECVFNKSVDGKVVCTICVYVDDLLVVAGRDQVLSETITDIKSKFREVKVNDGDSFDYVSLEVSKRDKGLRVAMSRYVNECLVEREISGVVWTPASNDFFDEVSSPALSREDSELFHSRVAKLQYLAKRVRPDILLAISCRTVVV